MNIFYIYAYLDPRKPCNFEYEDFKFDYEPFYIGKGKNNRCYYHLSRVKNKKYGSHPFVDKLRKILSLGLKPIIVRIKKDLLENEAFDLEKRFIKKLKEKCNLTNLNDGGIGGDNYSNQSPERKKEISEKLRKSLLGKNKKPRTEEEKKHLSKMLSGRIQPVELIKKRHKALIEKIGIKISKYDLNNNFIQSYDCINDASRDNNIRIPLGFYIKRACNLLKIPKEKELGIYKNFRWKYTKENE